MSEVGFAVRKKLVIDLDGTLCVETNGQDYVNPAPRTDVIRRVNEMWQSGWDVTICTARGMNRFEGNLTLIEDAFRSCTETWLKEHRVCYDRLVFGKPAGDLYVDNKGTSVDEFMRTA
jgi:capsule biosynthesis phosphatase